jgi:hypothetical protein
MRNAINLILICCCATAWAREEYKRDFQKTAALPAGRTFRIENSNGDIHIHTHAKNEAEIRASLRCSAGTAQEARSFCDQIQIAVQESAAGVSVRTEYPKTWNRRNLGYSVDYDLTLPETAPLDARNRFGGVSAVNLRGGAVVNNGNGSVYFSGSRGRLEIENSFGNVEVRTNDGEVVVRNGNGAVIATDVTGGANITNRFGRVRVANAGRDVTVRSNNGEIDIQNAGGPVSVDNSFGSVAVTEAKSDVTVRNQNGEVRATGVGGTADLHTTFGRVVFSRIGKAVTVRSSNATVTGDTVGETATVETSFGTVDVRGVKGGARVTAGNTSIRLNGIGGDVYAKTSFNGVAISDAAGPVTVENQNGSVTVEAKPSQRCQPISLRTSFGPIRVTVPGGVGYNVTARTSFGRVRSEPELTVSGEMSPEAISGKIGGGGCDLRLMGQNGSIDILRAAK